MSILLFIGLLTIFLFSSFTVSFRLQTINRVVIYTPIYLFETAIPVVDLDNKHTLHFDKDLLESNLRNYYDNNLKDVLNNYQMTLYYYNQKNESICTSSKCDAVEVTIEGTYIYFFSFSRSIKYEIHKGAKYGQ